MIRCGRKANCSCNSSGTDYNCALCGAERHYIFGRSLFGRFFCSAAGFHIIVDFSCGALLASTYCFVAAIALMSIADALAIVFVEPFILLLLGRFCFSTLLVRADNPPALWGFAE